MRALYPGSFDPLTLGHLDLIERGISLFGEMVIAVLRNPSKIPTFSHEQRVEQIIKATSYIPNVQVISFEGLAINCAKATNADVLLRGLRALSDFEYELQIAHTNRSIDNNLETVFLATAVHHSFLSSSVVKEVARFGGSISHMVPEIVAKDLYTLFNVVEISQ